MASRIASTATAVRPLFVVAVFVSTGYGDEPAGHPTIRLPSTVLSLNFDDDKVNQSTSPDWMDFLDSRTDEKVAAAFQVDLTDGHRGKGLSFNGKSSHVNTNVPLADVKTVAFWLHPRTLDEPFYLLNFHVSKTGFSLWSPGDGKKLMLSWFADDKWHGVSFEHGLKVNRWQRVLFSIDWAGGKMIYAVNGDAKEPVKFPPVHERFDGKLAISTTWEGKSLDGVIDDLQVSRGVLTEDEARKQIEVTAFDAPVVPAPMPGPPTFPIGDTSTGGALVSLKRPAAEVLEQWNRELAREAAMKGAPTELLRPALECMVAYYSALHSLGEVERLPNLDVEKLSLLHGQLVLRGAASPVGGQLGATLNLEEAMGGFKDGSDSARLAAAIKAGGGNCGDGKLAYRNESEWHKTMVSAGIDPAIALSIRGATAANLRILAKTDGVLSARQMQFDLDVAPRLEAGLSGDLLNSEAFATAKPEEAREVVIALAQQVRSMDLSVYCDDARRREALVKVLAETKLGGRLTEKERGIIAVVAHGTIEQVAHERLGYSDGTALIAMSNLRILELTHRHLVTLREALGAAK
jgi:hypothetical protein